MRGLLILSSAGHTLVEITNNKNNCLDEYIALDLVTLFSYFSCLLVIDFSF